MGYHWGEGERRLVMSSRVADNGNDAQLRYLVDLPVGRMWLGVVSAYAHDERVRWGSERRLQAT